jgi:hypothetical protein
MISIASFAAGAFMGRKFGLAAGYSVSSKVAGLIGKQAIAEEWNKASSDYWTLAKKDAFRDLTAAAGFITLGVASNLAGKALAKKEPQKEPGWFDNVPIINSLNKKIIIVGIGSVLTINWIKNSIWESSLNGMLNLGLQHPEYESLYQDICGMMKCGAHSSPRNTKLFETYQNLRNSGVATQNG